MREGPFLGIDLGTTYSSVAYIDFAVGQDREKADIEPSSIALLDSPSDSSAYLLPTLVDYGPSIPEVGRRISKEAGYVIEEFKPGLGLEIPPYRLPNGQEKRGEEVAIDVLRYLKRRAEDALGSSLGRVCLAMPPVDQGNFQVDKTGLMSRLGREAGFTSINVVEEPVAAILDIDFTTGILTHENKTIMVIDYGGGTCNVAIVRASYKRFLWANPPRPLGFSTERCGGKFIDEQIVDWIRNYRPEAVQLFEENLKEVARRLKEKISRFLQGEEIVNPSEIDEYDFRLDEETFRNLSHPVIRRMRDAIERALRQAQDRQEGKLGVDLVFLVGGGSKHPLVEETVIEYFKDGNMRIPVIERAEYPQLSISRGAALYDFYCSVGQLPMIDELHQELYLQFPDGSMKRLARLGQAVPFKRPNHFEVRVVDPTNEIVLHLKKRDPQSGVEQTYASPTLMFEDTVPPGTKIRLDVIVDLRQHTIIKAYTRKRAKMQKKLLAEVIVRSPVS